MGYATTERRMGMLMMRGFDNEEGTGGGVGEEVNGSLYH